MNVTTCKSCGAKIVWIKTQNGRSMPCNEEQVEYQKNYRGAALIVTKDGEVVRGNIIKEGGSALVPIVDGIGYVSHFATCPNADKHRRTRRND